MDTASAEIAALKHALQNDVLKEDDASGHQELRTPRYKVRRRPGRNSTFAKNLIEEVRSEDGADRAGAGV
jgi:hypothetical protein